jgi:prolyl 4-hydroxylase
MGEALNKWDDESNKTVAREDILDYLSFSTFKQGKIKMGFSFDSTNPLFI